MTEPFNARCERFCASIGEFGKCNNVNRNVNYLANVMGCQRPRFIELSFYE